MIKVVIIKNMRQAIVLHSDSSVYSVLTSVFRRFLESLSLSGKRVLIAELFVNGTSGALASLLSGMLLYPVDNIKTRQQFIGKLTKIRDRSPSFHSASSHEGQKGYRIKRKQKIIGTDKLIIDIYKNEGILGFYGGAFPFALATLFMNLTYFFFSELFKRTLKRLVKNETLGNMLASTMAGIISSVLGVPLWTIHSQTTVHRINFATCVKKVYSTEGPKGFFRG